MRKAGRIEIDPNSDVDCVIDTDLPPLEMMISRKEYENIIGIIDALPDTYRDVTLLSIVHQCSHAEIADLLGISNDAVRTRLSRAKKIIKAKLGR